MLSRVYAAAACDLEDPEACPSSNELVRCCPDTLYCDVPGAGACGE